MKLSFSYVITYFFLSCLVAAGQNNGKTVKEHKYDFQSTLKAHRKGEAAKTFVHKDATVETEVEYVAAALQYAPYDDLSAGGLVVLEENARAFIRYAGEARDMGAQIIVFPEYGLTSLNLGLTMVTFLAQTQVVPNPEDKEVPCEYGDVNNSSKICFDILYERPALSNIYNLGVRDALLSTAWIDGLPSLSAPQVWKGFSQGNNVNLVAANIYYPPGGFLGAGIFRGVYSEPEYYTYDTSSGNKLIVGKVKTKSAVPSASRQQSGNSEVFSYDDFDDLPLLGPSEMEERQTKAMEVIVNGKKKHKPHRNENMEHKYLHEDLSHYNHVILERTSPGVLGGQELCHEDGLCCNLSYEYPAEQPEDIVYMLIAYSGLVEHGEGLYYQYVQDCGVILCLNETIDSCGYFEETYVPDSAFRAYSLSGTFTGHYIYPSVFTDTLQLFSAEKWNYTLSESPDHYHAIIHLHEEVNDLSMLSLYARWFSRDPNH